MYRLYKLSRKPERERGRGESDEEQQPPALSPSFPSVSGSGSTSDSDDKKNDSPSRPAQTSMDRMKKEAEKLQLAPGLPAPGAQDLGCDESASISDEKPAKEPQLAPGRLPSYASSMSAGRLLNQDMDHSELGMPPDDVEGAVEAPVEGAIEGVLAPDVEQTRMRMMEEAVTATDVQAISTGRKKRNKWITVMAILLIVALAAVGVSLGVILGRKKDDSVQTTPAPTESPSETLAPDPPTPAPTSEKFSQIAALVETAFGISIEDASSPQYKAVGWMADVDEALDLSNVTMARFMQRYALVVFYFATGGSESWIRQENFLSPQSHECNWKAKSLEQTAHEFQGISLCDDEQQVTAIEFTANNLTGTLSDELVGLPSIKHLFLNSNGLTGTLPSSLFNLTNLEDLQMIYNDFKGTLSSDIGKLSALEVFALRTTSMMGRIPSEIGKLSDLQALSLANSSFIGSIPDTFSALSRLLVLDLSSNKLVGTITSSFSFWPNLTALFLQENQLNGSIAEDIGSLVWLQSLRLSSNHLTGMIPETVAAHFSLKHIWLDSNELTGRIPETWNPSLSQTLEYAFLRDNHLTGTVPAALGDLSSLQMLDLGLNALNGTIPSELGNARALQYLALDGNDLSGTVPISLTNLASLFLLVLQKNQLVGSMSFFCNETEVFPPGLKFLQADCFGEVECPCCTLCCDASDACAFPSS